MAKLPPAFVACYRPATKHEVRARSFGLLKAPRDPMATTWEQRDGTLEDQKIFGPVANLECACGKYRGAKHANMICDHCGVKVTTCAVRRKRFGHVELPGPVVHPFATKAELLLAIPVLPAVFVESRAGQSLADLYDELARMVSSESVEGLADCLNRLLDLLLPIAIVAHEWHLHDGETLAFGMALVPHASSAYETPD
jgi:hypothetical protein